ncbi:MAG: hypothetical protein D4R48_02525, partial [Nitrosomonadales bacterium]
VEEEIVEAPAAEEADLGIEVLPELEEPATDGSAEDMVLELPEMSAEEAAEDIGLEELADAPDESSAGFDLVLPEFNEPAAEEAAVEEAPPQADLVVEELSFELPGAAEASAEDIQAQAESAAEEISLEASVALPEVEQPAVDLEKTMVLQAPPVQEAPATAVESIVLETGSSEAGGEADLQGKPQAEAKAAPDVDFSGIDLDLGATGAAAAEPGDEEITLSSPESADVDTKLDLVTAYLDMGDKEGARELLQEVLDEGGTQQRERAQKMMDALD